jgi:heme-degrading monooxygenase HmoA
MPHVLVHHKVRNFAQWKPLFDHHESTRKTGGSKGAQVFQNADDSNDIFIIFEWDSMENAKEFFASDDLKKTMEQAGVLEMPHVHFLREVEKSKA